ncbi:MAG: hypothetical protein HOC43_10765 [Planctomycetes bacterium]|jgi:CRISPR-associated protein Cmr3|nr:hypothetical protein [Planctomycetota bacterium]
MKNYCFDIHALDTWFFRDGSSFHKGEPWQAGVASTFPPSPRVLSGALRAQFAREGGWQHGPWSPELTTQFGDWPDDPGQLSIVGVCLSLRGETLLPLPQHLMADKDNDFMPAAFAAPGEKCATDSGDHIQLSLGNDVPKTMRVVNSSSHWVTLAGWEKIRNGELPALTEIHSSHKLWAEEPRVGIHRDETSRTMSRSDEVRLYSPVHIRPVSGLALRVMLSSPAELEIHSAFPLGGESRLAQANAITEPLRFSEVAAKDGRFTLTQLTPALWPDDQPPQPNTDFCGCPGATLMAAVVSDSVPCGGWNGRKLESIPVRFATPSGSVWFLEGDAPTPDPHGFVRLGDENAHGFGLFTLGQWPSRS